MGHYHEFWESWEKGHLFSGTWREQPFIIKELGASKHVCGLGRRGQGSEEILIRELRSKSFYLQGAGRQDLAPRPAEPLLLPLFAKEDGQVQEKTGTNVLKLN